MNIKSIIGLGLLTFFTNCQTPVLGVSVSTQPANCAYQPAPVEQPRPLPILPTLPVCVPITLPTLEDIHVDAEGRIERCINRWTEAGVLHVVIEKEDVDHNVHKVHRFVRDGRPCEIDEWVENRSGASVHSHRYVAEDECLHEVRVVSDIQGRVVEQRHFRKDRQGVITELPCDSNTPVFPSQSVLLSQPSSTSSPQFSSQVPTQVGGVFPTQSVLLSQPSSTVSPQFSSQLPTQAGGVFPTQSILVAQPSSTSSPQFSTDVRPQVVVGPSVSAPVCTGSNLSRQ